jgi:SAM-dependent methyltransferase
MLDCVGSAARREEADVDVDADQPKLYGELAGWFHLLTHPDDYAEEAAIYRELLDATTDVGTVLELGSGGGNNASHLKAHYEMTLVDVSPGMVELSRSINPDCDHHVADMRTVRLDRSFDAVFIHDAIAYLLTLEDVRAAMSSAYLHLRPGGVVLLCPDDVRETFEPSTDHGGHDEGDRGLRYLEWTWDPDPAGTVCVSDFAYILRQGDEVEVAHDRHLCGLFPRADWLRTLEEVGFVDVQVRDGADGNEVFLAVRPEDAQTSTRSA